MQNDLKNELREMITRSLKENRVVILPPMGVFKSLGLCEGLGLISQCTMLDPWYNKGVGGERSDYVEYITSIINFSAKISEHIYLWGFPEIVARFVDKIPNGFNLTAWLTWYYKNCPSVIRGWRSSQNACLHMSKETARLYPQNFLNDVQKDKLANGKMRFIPGPSSVIEEPGVEDVIEEPLIIGFVGKKERTGHPAQKPLKVYEKLILMATAENELVIDPMAGSGTSGDVALKNNRKAIVCDQSEEFTQIMEKRLGVRRIELPEKYKEIAV